MTLRLKEKPMFFKPGRVCQPDILTSHYCHFRRKKPIFVYRNLSENDRSELKVQYRQTEAYLSALEILFSFL